MRKVLMSPWWRHAESWRGGGEGRPSVFLPLYGIRTRDGSRSAEPYINRHRIIQEKYEIILLLLFYPFENNRNFVFFAIIVSLSLEREIRSPRVINLKKKNKNKKRKKWVRLLAKVYVERTRDGNLRGKKEGFVGFEGRARKKGLFFL